jgi:Tol biopolymer transport system component
MIGLGGMGEVYEAEDTKAGQTVALKTIRVEMAGDAAQAERFRRELLIARNIAHRNVCKVFDYDDIDRGSKGRLLFFTMELLRGETLAQRLARVGRLGADAALEILEQVAAGLEEVHRCGIIHRDLKPSNIFLVPEPLGDGRAVVMDFGLARNLSEADLRQTRTGMVMGTRLYMPPELPKAAGVFSDVYSLGVVILEMVTGAPSPIVAPRSVVPSLDPAWDKALLACCNLDPAKRPSSMMEVVGMLRRRTRPWRKWGMAAGTAVMCLVVGAAIWNRINPRPTPVEGATQITFDSGMTGNSASSADGKLLAYSSDRDSDGDLNIWLQDMKTGTNRQITKDPDDDDDPTLSADGTWIAWRSGRESILSIEATAGGPARVVAKGALAPRLSPDGSRIAYWSGIDGERESQGHAWVIPAEGGTPREIAKGFADARLPIWSEDGKSILFRGVRDPAASLEAAQDWWIVASAGGTPHATGIGARIRAAALQPHDSSAMFTDRSVTFAARSGHGINIFSIGLYPWLGAVGAPHAITSGAGLQDAPTILSGGRVAFSDWREKIHLFRVNRFSGTVTQVTNQQSIDTRVSSSADGRTLAFGRRLGMARNIWVKDLRNGTERELASNELDVPFISPDGEVVAISSGSQIRLIDVKNTQQSSECRDCGELRGWIPHSRKLLYLQRTTGPALRLCMLDLDTKSKTTLLSVPGVDEAAVSPDKSTLAFSARSKGNHSAIFVARLTLNGAARDWEAITAPDGWAEKPLWSPDGKTVYYVSDSDGFQCIWSREVDATHLRAVGNPQGVAHFHKARTTLSHLSPATLGFAIGGDSLFLSLSLTEGNIWALPM